jgi:C4-dicarboxylate transporter DctM subunit
LVIFSGLANALADFVSGLDMSPATVMLIILLMYLIMGCFLDALAMILLTVPIFYPIVLDLGYDPIWFGIIVVMVVELGLITPPDRHERLCHKGHGAIGSTCFNL